MTSLITIINSYAKFVFRRFGGVVSNLLGASCGRLEAFWEPLGSLLEASLGPFEDLLGASSTFGAFGGRFDVEHHVGGLELLGRAVLEASWGRFCTFLRPFWTYF